MGRMLTHGTIVHIMKRMMRLQHNCSRNLSTHMKGCTSMTRRNTTGDWPYLRYKPSFIFNFELWWICCCSHSKRNICLEDSQFNNCNLQTDVIFFVHISSTRVGREDPRRNFWSSMLCRNFIIIIRLTEKNTCQFFLQYQNWKKG